MGSLKSPCTTSYMSSVDTIALNCLVFEKIAFFLHFGDRQTDKLTNKQTDKQMDSSDAWSRSSRYRELRLNNVIRYYNRTREFYGSGIGHLSAFYECKRVINTCIGDDAKAAARQSLNCIKNKNNKIWRKTIFNMADGILTPCNVARSRHWCRQVTAPCNVACGSGIVTVNSPSGSTLQIWDDMRLNSPKLPPYWNSTSGFHFHTSPQSTCHSVLVCDILSKSDNPRQKIMTSCRFSRWRISAILDFRGPIIGSLKSRCTTSYRS